MLFRSRPGTALDIAKDGDRLLAALRLVRNGELENDGFNRLVLQAGLAAHDVNVLRACCRYLLQSGVAFSQSYMERTLSAHPLIAADLHALFTERLDPQRRSGADGKRLLERLARRLDAIASADEDRILRAFLTLILAIERTNHYQRDTAGRRRPVLALKLNPQKIPHLPLPRPKHEIYVFGSRVDRKSTRLNSSHVSESRMPSSA